jgi:hypothetical protein
MYIPRSCADGAERIPWITYPQSEEIKIPFTYDPATREYTALKLHVVQALAITTDQQEEWRDSDGGTEHSLVRGGPQGMMVNAPVLVSVQEEQANDKDIVVGFTNITRDDQGIIRGYVQLRVALGEAPGAEGVMVLEVEFDKGSNPELESRE